MGEYSEMVISSDFTDFLGVAPAEGSCRTTEWLRGEQICTFSGKYHLAWSVPMYDPTYLSPGVAIHSFLMFAPFFVMKKNMIIQGVFLWLAGPFAASLITANLMEQASIWCFFSIAQIGIMVCVFPLPFLSITILNHPCSYLSSENNSFLGGERGKSLPPC